MSHNILKSIALAAWVTGAAWGQLTVTCTPATLPDVVQTVVSVSCSASSLVITPPVAWSISVGKLPPGLSLDSVGGTITGTLQDPAGAFSFTVLATDSNPILPLTGTQSYSGATVDPLTLSCTSPAGPLEVGIAYSNTCTATGGTTPYTWSIGGSIVPPGASITPNGTGMSATVTDTPAASLLAYQYSVAVVDSTSPTTLRKTQQFTGAIGPIITTASPLPAAPGGGSYSQQFAATAGTSPYSWTATGLPAWLSMSKAGLLSGSAVPATSSPVSFTASVTDSAGGISSGTFSLPVTQALTITTTSPLPTATIGTSYNQTMAASGGTSPYQWTVSTGSLPAGLSLSTGGAITGTPLSTAVTAAFTVKVTDSNNNTASGPFTLPVTLAITTTSPLPIAAVGTKYNQALAAVGGAPPYQWTVASGSLPGGLSLSTSGSISGTPLATAVTATFTATATDSTNTAVSAQFTLPVTLAVATTSLPSGTANAVYPSTTLQAEGGTPPYSGWTVASGALPSGLTLNSATGAIAGTPATAAGSPFSFKVTVKDSTGSTSAAQSLSIAVNPALTITTPSPLPNGTVGVSYAQTLAATGGAGGYANWLVVSGALPPGLTLNSATGAVGGKPSTTTGSPFTFGVTVQDSAGNTSPPDSLTLTINAALGIVTTGLANGSVGTPYSSTLTGTGGTLPYTWSLATGSAPLPGGLTLAPSTGIISGNPNAAGTFPFTIQLADSSAPPNSVTKPFTITIGAGLTITTTALPNATVGVAYSQTLTAAGGTQPYTWSISKGSLPSPLVLNSSTGAITGTPAAAATASFTVTVTDSASNTATQNLTLTIVTPPVITTTSPLPNATVGSAYSQALAASGGTPPYSWTVSKGSLPSGLSLSTAGTITGTPGVTGPTTFNVQLTDATGVTATQTFLLTVVTGLRISTTSPLPIGEVNIPYSQTFAVSGGVAPYTWLVIGGGLPPGVTLAASGLLSGTPTSGGSFNFTVQATDSNHTTASAAFAVTIAPALAVSTPASLSGGSVNTAYLQTLAATGGVSPYTWTLTAGALPNGLNLAAAGTVDGIPTAAGTFMFTAKVTDSLGGTASRQFSIVIAAGVVVTTPSTLPGAILNIPYSETLQAVGGTPPYTWINTAGSLPPGLTLRSNGTLSGSPTNVGTFSFTVQATDSLGHQTSAQLSLTVSSGLSVTTSTLPGTTVGSSYSQSLSAGGGTPPYTWSLVSGSLPGGLSLSSSGSITGTTKAAGTSSFTVEVTDSVSATATKQLSIVVAGPLSITTAATLPGASLNAGYTQTLSASGGTAPYTWALTAGALPSGLSLSSAGAITGAAKAAGTFQFTVTATDSAAATASQQFTLTVGGGLAITTTTLPGGNVGISYSQALTATGGTPPYTYTISAGSLPPGIAINGNILGGTPTKPGSYTFTIQVADSVSATATAQFTVAIGGLAITTSALPVAAVGASYSQTLSAAGTAPYTWTVTAGALPAGLSLDSSSGTISGTPTAAGTSNVTIQVTDSTNATASAPFTLTVISGSFTGLTSTASSGQQLTFTLTPGGAYPQDIAGQVKLAFTPDPSLASPADDPSIQFSTGGGTADFTIPANSTAPVSLSLQTGTVAGAIALTVSWQAGGAALAVPAALNQTIQIAPAVPVISGVTATTTATGFQVVITGYSNTREVSQATLQFTPASGQSLQTASVPVPLTSAAATWFGSSSSDQYGGQFVLTLPFTVTDGTASAIASISVQLVNSQGTSTSAGATL